MKLVLNNLNNASPQSFDVTGVSLEGLSSSTVGSSGAGSGAGKFTLSPITFTKPRDQYSTQLFKDSVSGTTISSAALEAFSPGASTPYETWQLKNALITRYQFGDDATGGQDMGELTAGSIAPAFDGTAQYTGPVAQQVGEIKLTQASAPTGGFISLPIYEDSWGDTVTTTSGSTGPTAGTASFSTVTVNSAVGPNTDTLWKALANGTEFDTVTITLQSPGASASTVYTLTNALLTRIAMSSGPSLLNSLSFDFQKIQVTVPGPDGRSSTTCWDKTQSAPC
jgi:type VI protein secretion system component Hcp